MALPDDGDEKTDEMNNKVCKGSCFICRKIFVYLFRFTPEMKQHE
jgi:hypothetical protein